MRALMFGAALAFVSPSAVLADDTMTAQPPTEATAPAEVTPSAEPTPPAEATPVVPAEAMPPGADPMTATYGNTIIVKGGGPESHTHYNADHTFNGIAPAFNYPYQGTWEITADGKLCRTFVPEVPTVSNPDCDVVPTGHAVGDAWTDDKGNNFTLVAGIQ